MLAFILVDGCRESRGFVTDLMNLNPNPKGRVHPLVLVDGGVMKLKCVVGEHEAGRQLRYFRREREF